MNNNDLQTYAGREEEWEPIPTWKLGLIVFAICLATYSFGIVIGALWETLL